MRIKTTAHRTKRVPRAEAAKDAWPARNSAWALTPAALIPFGSFVAGARRGRPYDGPPASR
jgi:hypothetical protein